MLYDQISYDQLVAINSHSKEIIMNYSQIQKILGDKAEYLLGFNKPKIDKQRLQAPGPDFIKKVHSNSNRTPKEIGRASCRERV